MRSIPHYLKILKSFGSIYKVITLFFYRAELDPAPGDIKVAVRQPGSWGVIESCVTCAMRIDNALPAIATGSYL